eukprot:904713_1
MCGSSVSSLFIIVVCFVYTTSAQLKVEKIVDDPFTIQISGDPLKNPLKFERLSQLNPRYPIDISEPNNQQRQFQVITPEEGVPPGATAKCITEKITEQTKKGLQTIGVPQTITMQDLQDKLNEALEAQNSIRFTPSKRSGALRPLPVTIKGTKRKREVTNQGPNVGEPHHEEVTNQGTNVGEPHHVTRQHGLEDRKAALALPGNVGIFTSGHPVLDYIAVRMIRDRPFTIEMFGGLITTPVFFTAIPGTVLLPAPIQFYIGERANRQNFQVIQPVNPDQNSKCIKDMRARGREMTTTEFATLLNAAIADQPHDPNWKWNPIHLNSRVAVTIINKRKVIDYNNLHPHAPISNEPEEGVAGQDETGITPPLPPMKRASTQSLFRNGPVIMMPQFYTDTPEGHSPVRNEEEGAAGQQGETETPSLPSGASAQSLFQTGYQSKLSNEAHEDYYNVDEVRYSDGVEYRNGNDDFSMVFWIAITMIIGVCGGCLLYAYVVACGVMFYWIKGLQKRTGFSLNDVEQMI